MCKLLVVNGSGSSVCKSLSHIKSIYNINVHREHSVQISSIKDMFDFDEQDKINVENIKCLLDMRHTYNSCIFPSNNCFTTGDLSTYYNYYVDTLILSMGLTDSITYHPFCTHNVEN